MPDEMVDRVQHGAQITWIFGGVGVRAGPTAGKRSSADRSITLVREFDRRLVGFGGPSPPGVSLQRSILFSWVCGARFAAKIRFH